MVGNERDNLILNNMRLVYTISKKYKPVFFEFEDIVQYGMLGLIHAANNFKEGNGKFKDYASVCIEGKIKSAFRDYTGKIGSAKDRANGKAILPSLFTYTEVGKDVIDLEEKDNFFNTQSQFEGNENVEEEVIGEDVFSLFSGRDKIVAKMLSEGYSYRLIANEVGISQTMVSYIVRDKIKPVLIGAGYRDEYFGYSKAL